jgi:4,5-dihydroxyphthalate decarboxylase
VADIPLTFASWHYDRVRALMDGSVKPEGIALTSVSLYPGETFQRMIQHREFDVAEMGFKFCEKMAGTPDTAFVAIPVFPVRLFLHSAIFVNKEAGIRAPKDLIGKKVGEALAYGHDAAIWARGILPDEYGVPIDSVTYVTGALDPVRRRDFNPFFPPKHIRVEPVPPGKTLDGMLESGEIAALYSAITPPSVVRGSNKVVRLFEDYETVERDYFRKTGIFPIVHLIAIRRDTYERHRFVAQSMYKAFKDAKDQAERMYRSQEANMHRLFMLPWMTRHQVEVRELMGDDWWPYGLEPNRKTLDTFLRYHHEQGLSARRLKPEELFAPETLTDYPTFV